MGLMDKVKAQATQLAQKTQETARDSKAKFDQSQANRRADVLLRNLGAAVYADRTGRGGEDAQGQIDKLIADISAHEAQNGITLAQSTDQGPAADAPATPSFAAEGPTSSLYFPDAPASTFPDAGAATAFPDAAPATAFPDAGAATAFPDAAPAPSYPDAAPATSFPDAGAATAFPDAAPATSFPDAAPATAFPDDGGTTGAQDADSATSFPESGAATSFPESDSTGA